MRSTGATSESSACSDTLAEISEARLHVRVSDAGAVARYVFGTETADFLVCARCGVAPLVTSRIDDKVYAVVNVNTFENVERNVHLGPREQVDERAEPRHEDDAGDPERLRGATHVAAAEDVRQREDPERDQRDPDQQQEEDIPERRADEHGASLR